ncbi:transglycosylase SLT domain-containing protein [Paraburkholderia acidisoli]|uniref:Transglycosylase SLT domain-containing protein n=1 Tax=Paraburkholderia acidisoli TaxID=2571748 RepID=A0A7Z2JFX6_9BURK|nr:transglycosylase SLT domain-containing protein [Paraburkholderia acidisoli]QGZ63216.1 transglycosylase SLT domain-containing protein [Paraburkholderia acidisoli]
MRQLLCVLALLPGLAQIAFAQASQTSASDISGASAAASLSASAAAVPPAGASTNASVSALIQKKFGVAKEKAARISQAVTTAAEKYSLPPAVLLAIISIESRFREKARGANGATGLMQVVPSAHRNLLRNGKDLTDPEFNIEVGSSILYGYQRAAGGNLDAAMKNYGGSKAYAEKIRLRATEFSRVLDPSAPAARSDDDAQASGIVGMSPAASAAMAFSAAATAAQAQNAAAAGAR